VLHRFYAPDLSADLSLVSLPAGEAEHLRKVLRLSAGASIVVFDGRGAEFLARVESIEPGAVRVRPVEGRPSVPEPAVPVTLAQAVLKGDHMDRVIRDSVMIGVTAVQPLATTRTELPGAARRGGSRETRWRRIALASAKQCGRAVLPPVGDIADLGEFLASHRPELGLMLVEPDQASPLQGGIGQVGARPRPDSATVLVGPEGGWAADEVRQAMGAGFLPVTLGRRTWRADAAPLAAMAVLQFLWGDL
jgi:16S rRNA (uracil1498-N3)-methyltransferase